MDTNTSPLSQEERQNKFNALLKLLSASIQQSTPNVYSGVSELWTSLFEHRKNTNQYQDLKDFLSENTQGHGAADTLPTNVDLNLFREFYESYVAPKTLAKIPLSQIGNPSLIDIHGHSVSASYLNNIIRFEQIDNYFQENQLQKTDLNILEIGAGYGGLASQLIYGNFAGSYTIIDLPENLILSMFYLSEQFPNVNINIVSATTEVKAHQPNTINLLIPNHIDALNELKFDLALNTDSLGEMPSQTAQAYINWISNHLSEQGIFYSKNGHRRSLGTTTLPSQYGYEKFDIKLFEPTPFVYGLFDDHSHVLFLKKNKTKSQNINWDGFDTLCGLFSLGIQTEVKDICKRLIENNLTSSEQNFLKDVELFLKEKKVSRKHMHLNHYSDSNLENTALYLRGIAAHLSKQHNASAQLLQSYIRISKSNVAETIAVFILMQQDITSSNYSNGIKTQFLVEEVKRLKSNNPMKRFLNYLVRNENIRYKATYPLSYRPSSMLKLKNIVMNIKERKSIATVR